MVSGLIHGAIHDEIWKRLGVSGEEVTWELGHARLAALRKRRAVLDAEEAVWMVACESLGAHEALGYGTCVEYLSVVCGWDPHTAMERLRVARALVKLPGVFARLADGEMSWSAARELTRVATPDTEKRWLDASAGLRAQDVQKLVSGRRPGDLPETPADESAKRHTVRFDDVSGTTMAMVRKAQDAHRRRTGESLDDDAFVAAVMQAYLAQNHSETATGAPAQVMVRVCPSCREGTVEAAGEELPLTAAEVERHCCDARVLPAARTDPVLSPGGSQRGPGDRATSQRGPGERPTSQRGRDGLARPAKPSPAILAEVERRAGLMRASELPKSVRELVVRRHHGKCAVPGCSNSAFLHVHHADLRSEGGTHDPNRLLPLCDHHHRCVHDGRLSIEGTAAEGFRFLHADRTEYGKTKPPDPYVSKAAATAFRALCHNGFKQFEARAAVDMIVDRIEPGTPIEEVCRMAFAATTRLPSQQHVFRVREARAVYLPSWAAAC